MWFSSVCPITFPLNGQCVRINTQKKITKDFFMAKHGTSVIGRVSTTEEFHFEATLPAYVSSLPGTNVD